MLLFLIIAAWLTLSTLVYAFIARYFLAPVKSVPVHIVVGVVFAAVLSPGGAVGHGVAPFSGGLMCIRLLLTETPRRRIGVGISSTCSFGHGRQRSLSR